MFFKTVTAAATVVTSRHEELHHLKITNIHDSWPLNHDFIPYIASENVVFNVMIVT